MISKLKSQNLIIPSSPKKAKNTLLKLNQCPCSNLSWLKWCFVTVTHLQCDYAVWLLSTVQNITATCSVIVSQRGTGGQKQCLSIIHKDREVFKWKRSPQKCIVRHLKDPQILHTPTSPLLHHARDAESKLSIPLFSTGGMSDCLDWFSPGRSSSSRRAAHTVPPPRRHLVPWAFAFLLRLFGHIR